VFKRYSRQKSDLLLCCRGSQLIDRGDGFDPAEVVRKLAKGLILEINRNFPYQVALAFDEDAMGVLDWLEGCEFQWDMYVDLPENTVRYCFRTLDDASAFKRRFGDAPQGRAVASGH
jgi:hypothetical protein